MKKDMPKRLSTKAFPTFFLSAPKNLSPLSKVHDEINSKISRNEI